MHHAANVYGKLAKQTAGPRELEANLLLQSASRMQAIRDHWSDRRPDLEEALLYNRKLWSIFLTSVTRDDHPLPKDIRQNVANLGVFVISQTMSLMSDPRPDNLGSLIKINRELAAGLLSRG